MRKDAELSQQLKVMMGKAKDRQIGDYEYTKEIDCENSETDVDDAKMVINAIEEYLKNDGYLSA